MVYLLTSGDGSDGDEWSVIGIYSTPEKAQQAKRAYETHPHIRGAIAGDSSVYYYHANEIEEWALDPQG